MAWKSLSILPCADLLSDDTLKPSLPCAHCYRLAFFCLLFSMVTHWHTFPVHFLPRHDNCPPFSQHLVLHLRRAVVAVAPRQDYWQSSHIWPNKCIWRSQSFSPKHRNLHNPAFPPCPNPIYHLILYSWAQESSLWSTFSFSWSSRVLQIIWSLNFSVQLKWRPGKKHQVQRKH